MERESRTRKYEPLVPTGALIVLDDDESGGPDDPGSVYTPVTERRARFPGQLREPVGDENLFDFLGGLPGSRDDQEFVTRGYAGGEDPSEFRDPSRTGQMPRMQQMPESKPVTIAPQREGWQPMASGVQVFQLTNDQLQSLLPRAEGGTRTFGPAAWPRYKEGEDWYNFQREFV